MYAVSFQNPSGSPFSSVTFAVTVLQSVSFWWGRKIHARWTTMNFDQGSYHLPPIYAGTILQPNKNGKTNSSRCHWWSDPDGFRKLCVTFQNLLVLKYICFHCNTCKIPFGVLNICLQFQISMEKVWITMDARCSRGLLVRENAHKPNIYSYFDSESILSVEYLNL